MFKWLLKMLAKVLAISCILFTLKDLTLLFLQNVPISKGVATLWGLTFILYVALPILFSKHE